MSGKDEYQICQLSQVVVLSKPFLLLHQHSNLLINQKLHVDQKEFNEEQIDKLNKRCELLKSRINQIYIDKLDKKIDENFWREKHNEWQYKIAVCMEKIKEHTQASIDYMYLGGQLLELLKNLYPRYIQQNNAKKRNCSKSSSRTFLFLSMAET